MGALTRQFVVASIIASLGAATVAAETIYYAVSEGQHYDRQSWRTGDLDQFKRNRPENVFDVYTVHRLQDGRAKVVRERTTPSGDWTLTLTYHYDKDGRLAKMEYDLRTFYGVCPCGETGPVRCERFYSVDRSGRPEKISERITEMKSGNTVDWTFAEPKTKHWARLSELPIRPR